MENHTFRSPQLYPFWLMATLILFGLCMLVVVLSFGRFILMPLAFAAIMSMLLNPIVIRFETWKMGRVFSIILVLLIMTVIISGILTLFAIRAVEFTENLPETAEKLRSTGVEGIIFVEQISGISQERLTVFVKNRFENLFDSNGNFLNNLAEAATGTVTFLALLPIYIFFMLYYKKMYKIFIQKIFEKSQNSEIDKVLLRVQKVTQNYLVGLFTVLGIMAVLNSIGLSIIGLDYAIPFAIIASMLAIIPFVGSVLGAIPAVLYAFIFYDTLIMPLLAIAVFTVVQLVESSFLTPRIIGSSVSINPFMAIIVLLVGGKIWGIAGMILFIPLLGIMRVALSQIHELKPYGYLLGNIIEYNKFEEIDKKEHDSTGRPKLSHSKIE